MYLPFLRPTFFHLLFMFATLGRDDAYLCNEEGRICCYETNPILHSKHTYHTSVTRIIGAV